MNKDHKMLPTTGGTIDRLAGDALILMFDLSSEAKPSYRIEIDGVHYRGPARSTVLPLGAGRGLACLILRQPEPGSRLRVVSEEGRIPVVSQTLVTEAPRFDPATVLDRLSSLPAAARFCRFVLEAGLGAMKLRGNTEFQSVAGRLLGLLRARSQVIKPEHVFTSGGTCRLAVVRPVADFGEVKACLVQRPGYSSFLGVRHMDWTHSRFGRFTALPLAGAAVSAKPSEQTSIVMFTDGRPLFVDLKVSRHRPIAELPNFAMSSGAPHDFVQFAASVLLGNAQEDADTRNACQEAARLLPPITDTEFDQARAMRCRIDTALMDREGHLLVRGEWADPFDLVEKLEWIGPGGIRLDIKGRMRLLRPVSDGDGDKLNPRRFVASLDAPPDYLGLLQQRFEIRLRSGRTAALVPPPPPIHARAARDLALSMIEQVDVDTAMVAKHFSGLVKTLHAQTLEGERVEKVVEIGPRLAKPETSVVIPVYKVLEFLRYQFSAFALDADFKQTELIFVVDSPEIAVECEERLRCFEALYGGSITMIVHSANFGYAPATNTGAAHARGDTLVLLNSDVVPDGPGWIGRMRARLRSEDNALAVGPVLLFEDGSVQHAGLSFRKDLRGQVFNAHPMKGFSAGYAGARKAGAVDGLTGACILLARSTFESIGGLSEDYVIGDYEDSDFSLKLRATGGSLWIEPEARLYHYERQSIGRNTSYTETRASTYNRWLHGQRWQTELDASFGKS